MPWATAAAVTGGASILGGLIGASGAKDAASKQAAATDRAVGETRRQYEQTRSDLAPYRTAGTAALSRLQKLLGLDRGPGGAATGPIAQDQFDANAYLAANPDVAQAGVDPYGHYVQFGMNEGRQGYKLGDFGSTDNSPLLRKFTQSDLEADVPYNSGLQFGLDEGRKAIERRASAGGGYDSGGTLKALTRFGNDYGSTKAEGAYGRFVGNQGDIYGRLTGVAGLGAGETNVGVNAGTNTATNLAQLYTGQGNASGAAAIAGANAVGSGIGNAANYYGQSNLLAQLQGGGARTLRPDPNLTGASDLVGPTST